MHPNFKHLIGYFHQDWKMEAPTVEGVLEIYLKEWSLKDITEALSELRSLLTHSDDEVEKILDLMHCAYYPPGVGITYREWLIQVANRLEEFLQNSSPRSSQ